jgi:hypothetical protein
MQRPAIDCSAQMGGKDVDAVLQPHFHAFKMAFAYGGAVLPCIQIERLAFVVRADGAVQKFNFEGCENVDLNRKKKYISIDVGVPISRWQDRSDAEIAAYLIDSMWEGLEEMLAHLAANKIVCDAAAIRALFEIGMQRYRDTWNMPGDSVTSR